MRHLPVRRETAPNLVFWLPTFAGVLVLLAALIFTVMRLYDSPEAAAGQLPQPIAPFQAPTPASVLPQLVDASSSAPASSGEKPAPSGETPAQPTVGPTATPSRTARPPTSAPAVFGTYRVLDSYGDNFIGEVLVTNKSQQDQNWTVTLRLPSTVGKLNTSWVEGAPQATLSTSGATYTWRSGVPVPGGSSVPLRFQFFRSGTGNYPTTCTTNGTACTIN